MSKFTAGFIIGEASMKSLLQALIYIAIAVPVLYLFIVLTFAWFIFNTAYSLVSKGQVV